MVWAIAMLHFQSPRVSVWAPSKPPCVTNPLSRRRSAGRASTSIPIHDQCERQELVKDDFLFKAGTMGKPNFDQHLAFMNVPTTATAIMDPHTKRLVGRPNVLREFLVDVESRDDDDPYQNCP